ncbi:hypothetical protein P7C70_g2446, partial [Phenoliferia sp. Uapishka_3]
MLFNLNLSALLVASLVASAVADVHHLTPAQMKRSQELAALKVSKRSKINIGGSHHAAAPRRRRDGGGPNRMGGGNFNAGSGGKGRGGIGANTRSSAAVVATATSDDSTTNSYAAETTTSAAVATTSASTSSSASGSTYSGKATYFYQEGGTGACGAVNVDSAKIVAIQSAFYTESLCGKTVVITNTANSKTVTATVADECPGCSSKYSLDLSTGAFDSIGDEDTGVLDISWSFAKLANAMSQKPLSAALEATGGPRSEGLLEAHSGPTSLASSNSPSKGQHSEFSLCHERQRRNHANPRLATTKAMELSALAVSATMVALLVFQSGRGGFVGAREQAEVKSSLECIPTPTELIATPPRFDKALVLNFNTSQDSYKMQLKRDVRYVTTMSYGGHANQFIGIYNLLYLGKVLNRVVIIPTLIPLHFDADPLDMSAFFDVERFNLESGIPAIMLSDLKHLNMTNPPPWERISCWSVHERVTPGGGNGNDGSMRFHSIDVDYWAMPEMRTGYKGGNIWFNELDSFDADSDARQAWIETVKEELLPQERPEGRVAVKEKNLKYGFDPRNSPEPNDQILCFDTTLFIGSNSKPPAYIEKIPIEPKRSYEGEGWIQAGQYLHFTDAVEALADEYLRALFDVSYNTEIPPFITVHIRRSDFKEARGLTPLSDYTDGVARIRSKIQARMDDRTLWNGPGKDKEAYPGGILAKDYAVVVTSDEESDSPFVKQLHDLGWKVLDHTKMGTIVRMGEWYPTIIDQAILARGRGFMGTEWSTYSYLGGLRVRYWNGGVEDWTHSL